MLSRYLYSLFPILFSLPFLFFKMSQEAIELLMTERAVSPRQKVFISDVVLESIQPGKRVLLTSSSPSAITMLEKTSEESGEKGENFSRFLHTVGVTIKCQVDDEGGQKGKKWVVSCEDGSRVLCAESALELLAESVSVEENMSVGTLVSVVPTYNNYEIPEGEGEGGELKPLFEDAGDGPLREEDQGEIVEVDEGKSKPYKVKALTGSRAGKTWWYLKGAITPITSEELTEKKRGEIRVAIGDTSSGTESAVHLLERGSSSHWESSGSFPHFFDVLIPEGAVMTSVQLFLKDHESYSPKRLIVTLDGELLRSEFEIPNTLGWYTIVPEQMISPLFSRSPRTLRVQITENYQSGRNTKVCAVRVFGDVLQATFGRENKVWLPAEIVEEFADGTALVEVSKESGKEEERSVDTYGGREEGRKGRRKISLDTVCFDTHSYRVKEKSANIRKQVQLDPDDKDIVGTIPSGTVIEVVGRASRVAVKDGRTVQRLQLIHVPGWVTLAYDDGSYVGLEFVANLTPSRPPNLLHASIQSDHASTDLVKLLLSKCPLYNFGQNALHVAMAVKTPEKIEEREERRSVVRILTLASPGMLAEPELSTGRCPLQVALESGAEEESVRFLIESSPDSLCHVDKVNQNSLHYAIRHQGHNSSLIRLIADTSPLSLLQKDIFLKQPWHYSMESESCDEEVMMYLFDMMRERKELLSDVDTDQRTPLHYLVRRKRTKALSASNFEKLFHCFSRFADRCDVYGRQPLHYMAIYRQPESVVDSLLKVASQSVTNRRLEFESAHPFVKSEVIEVCVPRGYCNILFKPNTDISEGDGVTIYRDHTRTTVWGKKIYKLAELPGLHGNPALTIPGKSFFVHLVSSRDAKEDVSNEKRSGVYRVLSGHKLNIRPSIDLSAEPVGILKEGDEVEISDEVVYFNPHVEGHQIRRLYLKDGRGWVHHSDHDPTGESTEYMTKVPLPLPLLLSLFLTLTLPSPLSLLLILTLTVTMYTTKVSELSEADEGEMIVPCPPIHHHGAFCWGVAFSITYDESSSSLFSLRSPLPNPIIIESSHPYDNNEDKYQTVCIPEAAKYSISFSSECKTEEKYDYCKFYKDSAHKEYWGQEKYSGDTFPGVRGQDPLVIPAKSFVFHFHSDGSTTYWGYRITVKPIVELSEDERKALDGEGKSTLYYACLYNAPFPVWEKVYRDFPSAANISCQHGNLPLHALFITPQVMGEERGEEEKEDLASISTLFPIAQQLVLSSPSSCSVKNDSGQLPMHLLCSIKHDLVDSSAIMKLLIERNPAAATAKDHNGHIPLWYLLNRLFSLSLEEESTGKASEMFLECMQILVDAYPSGSMALIFERLPTEFSSEETSSAGKLSFTYNVIHFLDSLFSPLSEGVGGRDSSRYTKHVLDSNGLVLMKRALESIGGERRDQGERKEEVVGNRGESVDETAMSRAKEQLQHITKCCEDSNIFLAIENACWDVVRRLAPLMASQESKEGLLPLHQVCVCIH